MWGAEHGVSERRVAIGNEKVFTVVDPYSVPPALIGMDLVRLGLERADSAREALTLMTDLLEEHGQGGIADAKSSEPYFSSFLIADPSCAWVLETADRTWAARQVDRSAAISNRLTLRTDWTVASNDILTGSDFDAWRDQHALTGLADGRLDASKSFLSTIQSAQPASLSRAARVFVSHLRDHGSGPWGEPGSSGRIDPPPRFALPDGTGVSICLHARGYQTTTSSMVAALPSNPDSPLRAWVACGSPCISVFVPVFPPSAVPAQFASRVIWQKFANLRDRVESDESALEGFRSALDPLEAELWEEADEIADDPSQWDRFAADAGARLVDALTTFG